MNISAVRYWGEWDVSGLRSEHCQVCRGLSEVRGLGGLGS